MSSDLVACKIACGKAIKEAAFAAGDAAAARAIADIADGGVVDESLWKRVFADTEAVDLPMLQKERAAWAFFFADLREHSARQALENLKQQAGTWAALDSPSIRQSAGSLADSASKISADESLDATIRAAAAGALAEAARILSAAVPA